MRVGEMDALITANASQFNSTVDGAGKKWSGFQSALEKGMRTATTVVAASLAAAGGLTKGLHDVGVSYNTLQQSSLAALTTMLGSQEAALAQLEKFNDFARSSPFAKDVFLQAQQQLLGFGVEAKNVIPILDAVQNAVAAAGGSSADIAGLVDVFAKIQSQGKITGEELMQFGGRGVDAAQLIADSMGKTRDEIKSMISEGKLDADTAIDAIVSGMDSKFGGAAANLKNTFEGARDRIKGAWRDMGGDLMAPFVDPMGGGYYVTWANDVADVMRAMQKKIEPIMSAIMDRWGGDLDKFHIKAQELKILIESWDASKFGAGLDTALARLKEFAPFLGVVGGAMGAMMTQTGLLGGALGMLGLSINPLVGAMLGLIATTPGVRTEMSNLGTALLPLLTIGSEVTVKFAAMASEILEVVAPALVRLATAVAESAEPIVGLAVPAIEALSAVMIPVANAIAFVADGLAQLPAPILAGAAAFLLLKGHLGPLQAGLTKTTTMVKGFGETFATAMLVAKQDGIGALTTGLGGVSGAATKAGNALKTAFLNNAVGLAITGIVMAISAFAIKSQEATARADAYRTALEGVGDSATETAAALDEVTKNALVTGENMDWGWFQKWHSGFDTAADAIDGLGLSMDDFSNAVHGTDEEFNAFVETVRAAGEDTGYTRAATEIINKLGQQRDAAGRAAHEMDQLAGSSEELANATYMAADANRDLIVSEKELADYRAGRINAADQAIRAESAYADQLERTRQGLEDGSITADNAKLAMADLARSMRDTADANFALSGDASAANAEMANLRATFIEVATQALGSAEAAEQLANDLGLVEGTYKADIEADTFNAEAALDGLRISIDETTGEVKINGTTIQADQTLAELGLRIDQTDGTVTIKGNKYPATMTVAEWIGETNTSEGTVTVQGDKMPADQVLMAYIDAVNRGSGTVTIGGKDYPAQNVLRALQGQINTTGGNVNIGANDGEFQLWRGRWNGATVGSGTYRVNVAVVGGVGAMAAAGLSDGAVLKFFGNGGHENHVAAHAPAGAWRIWAEPETGGETYIPHAPSKRPRSTRILAETAQMFGYQLIPTGAKEFKDGSTPAMASNRPNIAPLVVRVPYPAHVTVVDPDQRLTGSMRVIAVEEATGVVADWEDVR